MSEINEQEKNNVTCECCAGNADNSPSVSKKSSGNVVRIVVWTIVAVLIVCFFIFKKDITQYIHNKRIIQHIYEKGNKDFKQQLFKVEYIGDNKFKVTVEDPAAMNDEESNKYSRYNTVIFKCEVSNGEAVLSFADSKDEVCWSFWQMKRKK